MHLAEFESDEGQTGSAHERSFAGSGDAQWCLQLLSWWRVFRRPSIFVASA